VREILLVLVTHRFEHVAVRQQDFGHVHLVTQLARPLLWSSLQFQVEHPDLAFATREPRGERLM